MQGPGNRKNQHAESACFASKLLAYNLITQNGENWDCTLLNEATWDVVPQEN